MRVENDDEKFTVKKLQKIRTQTRTHFKITN